MKGIEKDKMKKCFPVTAEPLDYYVTDIDRFDEAGPMFFIQSYLPNMSVSVLDYCMPSKRHDIQTSSIVRF